MFTMLLSYIFGGVSVKCWDPFIHDKIYKSLKRGDCSPIYEFVNMIDNCWHEYVPDAIMHKCDGYVYDALSNGVKWRELYTEHALSSGNLTLLKNLENKYKVWYKDSFAYAARYGDELTCRKLIKKGSLSEDGKPYIPRNAPTLLAARGFTRAMNDAFDKGCARSSTVILEAARNGHTETMLAAVAAGCEWHLETTLIAARKKHNKTLRAALKADCPCHLDTLYEIDGIWSKLFAYLYGC